MQAHARTRDATAKGRFASGYEGAGPIGIVVLVRQGMDEFLAFPLMIVAAFVALAAFTLWLDNTDLSRIRAARELLGRFVFVTEVTMGRVGVVLGIEMSRLARTGRDWHQLLGAPRGAVYSCGDGRAPPPGRRSGLVKLEAA